MARLQPLADHLWSFDYDVYMPGRVHFPCRTVVIELPSGGLALWSPGPIDDALAAELAALGPVRVLVAPSQLHHLHAESACARYPEAELWAAPGVRERYQLPVDRELGSGPLPETDGALALIEIEGCPKARELVLFDSRSRTLVVVDLVFHVRHSDTWQGRLVFTWIAGTYGHLGQSRMWRWVFTKDRAAAGRSVQRVLEWDFRRLVPCHGEVVEQNAQDQLRAACWWMLQGV